MSAEDTEVTRPPSAAPSDDRTVLSKPSAPPPVARAARGGGPLGPGQLLGNTYEIEALLARGGMGEVYRARHVELGSIHAIKVILPELAEDTHIITLFTEEARKLRRLRSDAIVAYEGLFRDEEGVRYLVMEFVDGPSLAHVLKTRKLDVDDVRALRDRCASGLAAAHDKGVFHRDISPDNIILVGEKVDQAKIIDFGIAKSSDPGDKTVVGNDFAGKYSYVAPEQLGMYGGKVDGRADMYSLGLVLVAAARGRSIDMGNSPASVIQARQAVPDLSSIPEALRAEIAPLLEPDPDKRPPSMRHLPGLAANAVTAPPTTMRPVSAPAAKPAVQPAGKSSGMMIPLVVGGIAFLAIAGGGGYLLYPALFPPHQIEPPKEDTSSTTQNKPPPPPHNDTSTTNPAGGTTTTHPDNTTTSTTGQATSQTQEARLPVPTRASVQSQLQTIVGRFDCAGLTYQVGDDLRGTVTGFARTTDLGKLRSAVADLGPGVAVSAEGVTGYVWPHCAVVSLLNASTAGGASGPRITLNNPSGKYHDKDKLIINLTTPTAGFLQVDFYDSSGSVQHIYPSSGSGQVHAGQQISLGQDGTYQIGAPFGPNLISAVLSPQRLFATARPPQEDARAYLAELQNRIKSSGAAVGGNFVTFDAAP
ncbi:MAG TPA: protein kinase [Stellaceae bacterium]|nr:protein kinase [Stellaceae bacterium]